MAFGGAIKLKGASEYSQACKKIRSELGLLGAELKNVDLKFGKNNHSLEATTVRNENLTKQLELNRKKYGEAEKALEKMSQAAEESEKAHKELGDEYNKEKTKLEELRKSGTATADEIEEQEKKVGELADAYKNSEKVLEANAKKLTNLKKDLINTESAIIRNESAIEDNTKAYEANAGAIEKAKINLKKIAKAYGDAGRHAAKAGADIKEGFASGGALGGVKALGKAVADTTRKLKSAGGSSFLSGFKKEADEASGSALNLGTIIKGNLISEGIIGGFKSLAGGAKLVAGQLVQLGKQSIEAFAEQEQLIGGVKALYGANGASLEDYAKKVGKSTSEAEADYKKLLEAEKMVIDNSREAFKTAGMSSSQYMETATSLSASLVSSLGGDTIAAANATDVAMRAIADNASTTGTSIESVGDAFKGFAKGQYNMLDNLKLGYGGSREEMERLLSDAEKLTGVKYDISNLNDVTNAIQAIQTEMGIAGNAEREAMKTLSGSANMVKNSWADAMAGIADENANFEQIIAHLVESLTAFLSNLAPRLLQMVDGAVQLIMSLVEKLIENFPAIMDAGAELLGKLVEGMRSVLPKLWGVVKDLIKTIVTTIAANLPQLMDSGYKLINSLVSGIAAKLPTLVPKMVDAVLLMTKTLVANLPQLLSTGFKLIVGLVSGIVNALPKIVATIPVLISSFVSGLIGRLPEIAGTGLKLIASLAKGLLVAIPTLIGAIPTICASVIHGFLNADWLGVGRDIVRGIMNGFHGVGNIISSAVRNFKSALVGKVKSVFGINSPSRVFRDEVGNYLAEGVGVGFEGEMKSVSEQMANAIPREFDTSATVNIKGGVTSSVDAALEASQGAGASSVGVSIEDLKEALKSLKIELDGDEVGNFVDRTAAALIYS